MARRQATSNETLARGRFEESLSIPEGIMAWITRSFFGFLGLLIVGDHGSFKEGRNKGGEVFGIAFAQHLRIMGREAVKRRFVSVIEKTKSEMTGGPRRQARALFRTGLSHPVMWISR